MTAPFPTIAGLELPREYLARAAAGDTGHHALLLHGPAGIGKLALALVYARALQAPMEAGAGLFGEETEGPTYDPISPDAHLIRIGSHPDVIVFSRPRELLAEEARELLERMMTSPQRGRRKVVILDAAEQFNPTVANLLLKTLEEPPPWGQFLLLTDSPESLLPTIRSRTLPVPCRETSAAAAIEALGSWLTPEDHASTREVALSVGGRVGDVIRFGLLPGHRAFRQALLHWLERMVQSSEMDFYELVATLDQLQSQWEALAESEPVPVGGDLRDIQRWRENPDDLPAFVNFHPADDAPPAGVRQEAFLRTIARLALAAWHTTPALNDPRMGDVLQALRRAPLRMRYNANWQLVLEGLVMESFGFVCGEVSPTA